MPEPLLPITRPKITLEQTLAIIRGAGLAIEASLEALRLAGRIKPQEEETYAIRAKDEPLGAVRVVAIRGYYLRTMGKPTENDRGIYDDALILMGPNYYQTFNANTDPSTEKPGMATLLPGWHLFKQGWHGYGKPSGHRAFRPANVAEVLPVLRDGQKGIKQGLAINLHSGGFVNTGSAGCQTVRADEWREFQNAAYKLMDKEGQKTLPYLLVEQKYLL